MALNDQTRTGHLVLWTLCLVTATSSVSLDASTQQQLDQVVSEGMRCKHIPSLALAVVKDDQVVLSKGYGVKDMDTQEPVTENTLFQIASLTKAFAAALLSNIMSQDSSRKMSTSVHRSLAVPQDFHFNNSQRTTYATIEDLLSHRTGVPRNSFLRLATDYSIDTLVDKIRYLPSVGGFRDSFYYNDLMYGLASHIAEVWGQAKWEQQIRDLIFTPLGMSQSTFISEIDFNAADVATPYVLDHGHLYTPSIDFIKHWGKNTGSGSIYSSVRDMAKWMMMLLNGGQDNNGSQVLRDGVVTELFKPANVIPPSSYSASYRRPVVPETFSGDVYALGWKKGYYREYEMLYHSGSTFGYRGFLTLLPEMNLGVVSLMTGSDVEYKLRTSLHEYVMDVALGLTPWINSSTICTFPDPWKSAHRPSKRHCADTTLSMEEIYGNALNEVPEMEDTMATQSPRRAAADNPTTDLQPYTGTFHHGAYGDLTVRLNTSIDALQIEYGVGAWRLQQSGSGHHFEGHWLKGHPTLSGEFLFHSYGQEIISVEALNFEKSLPPLFFRTSGVNNGGTLIG